MSNLPNTCCRASSILMALMLSATALGQDPAAGTPDAGDGEKLFQEQIQPILEEHCWDCHGSETQESGLRLDTLAGWQAGGHSGKSLIVAEQPSTSYIVEAMNHAGDIAMPPDDKLPDEMIASITKWIGLGMPWPGSAADATANRPLTKEELLAKQRAEHWAFQPIVAPTVQTVTREDWIAQPLDRFILAHLESQSLTPSPEADKYTLIRRLKFDLLGLPPTQEEVQAYLGDDSPQAYERLVDRYLSSPQYGERWGRHWLDVARYADTRGYAFAQDRRYPYSYTYRDYVIRALNEDRPFDRFVLEQLAADLLSLDPHDPALAALGFLTVGRKFNNRHLDIDDQIDVVGRGLLGLTVSCARCHDHKYDPIPTQDYYSLYGVFASSHEPDDLPTIGDPTQTPGYDEFQRELEKLRSELAAYVERKREEITNSAQQHATDYFVRAMTSESEESLSALPFIALKGEEFKPHLVRRWQETLARDAKADHPVWGPLAELAAIPDNEFADKSAAILDRWKSAPAGTATGQLNPLIQAAFLNPSIQSKIDLARVYGQIFSETLTAVKASAEQPATEPQQQICQLLSGPGSLTEIQVDLVPNLLTRAEGNEYRELQRKIQAYQADAPGAPPRAMIVRESETPHHPHVFIRGNHNRPGEEVPRQFLSVVAGPTRQPFKAGSGRLELAQAILSPDNPLTARVLVNRVWMHHFGSPLVNTPSDFGVRSQRPVQADTLDYLAAHLRDTGWSLKQLHCGIVLSSTYRQASAPRDDCAQVDPENTLYWRANRRRLEFEALRDATLAASGELDTTMGGRPVELAKEPYSLRRSIYGYIDRQDLPGLFRVFDLASPDSSCPQRARTTVPQQSLFLMNSPFVMERAKHIAARPEVMSASSVAARVTALFNLVFARDASPEEAAICQAYIAPTGDGVSSAPEQTTWEQLAHVLLMSNAFVFVD
jgi:mono/diheme cytochrome c family protein